MAADRLDEFVDSLGDGWLQISRVEVALCEILCEFLE